MLQSLLFIIIICAVALLAFCEPSAKYEVATILDVKPLKLPVQFTWFCTPIHWAQALRGMQPAGNSWCTS